MFRLLVFISLIASHANGVFAVTLDESLLNQRGYNNQSSYIYISIYNIDDIDPNAFKGYTSVTTMRLESSQLTKVDLSLFKDMVNLDSLSLSYNIKLTQLTNAKKIMFPSMTSLQLSGCPLINLDSNVTNALPKLQYFYFNLASQLKFNQLSQCKKLQTLEIETKNQTSLTKEHFNGLSSLISLSFINSNIKTIEVHTFNKLPNLYFIDLRINELRSFEYLQIPPNVNALDLSGNKMNYFKLSRTMGVIQRLFINQNLFRSFKSMDFTFLTNLTHLELSNNPHAYPNEIAGHLKPLVNLSYIGLRNLSILSINSNFFKQSSKFQYIDLSYNKISSLSFNTFNHLKGLVWLYLSYNQISVLDNRTFVGLENLFYLSLESNKFTRLFPRTFYNLSKLYSLFISDNLISEIDKSAFTGCYNLKNIDLANNKLSKISPGTFANLTLTGLNLNSNKLTELDNSMFAGVNSIDAITLSNNNISRIDPKTFNSFKIAKVLYLSYNQLTKIENGTFSGQNQLTLIDLRYNKINTIESGAFNGLNYLEYFYLSNNSLIELNKSTFAGVNSISDLYLNDNKISRIEPGTFNSLNITTSLYLHNNFLTKIENETFVGLSQLSYLYLNNNMIDTIEAGSFNGLTNIHYIYLGWNNLTQLDNSTFFGCNNLVAIFLYNNPNLKTSDLQSLCPTAAVSCKVYF